MSSVTKRTCFIGIHRAPPNLSREEFERKAGVLGDAIAALPVAQKNLLKLDIVRMLTFRALLVLIIHAGGQISQNTLMDEHMLGVGLPVPETTVVMSAEYEVQPLNSGFIALLSWILIIKFCKCRIWTISTGHVSDRWSARRVKLTFSVLRC
jgi:hypothetical protein